MNLEPYVEDLHRHLETAADAGGDEARALVERFVASSDAAIRLTLQDALTAAAEVITVDLAPGSVEVRLRGREPEFVVTPPPIDPIVEETGGDDASFLTPSVTDEAEDTTIARINLRLPEHLKARVERAAEAEGLSVNAWLVRATASAVDRTDPPRRHDRRAPHGAQRYSGWAR